MQLEITKRCADSLRSFSDSNFGILIKSSHAHELVAAYFGYSSRAALLADTKHPISNLRQAEIIVLTPTAEIKKRRNELKELPENLPDDIAEGVYFPLYEEKWILHTIWPTFEYLGFALADQHLKLRPAFFRDQKIQRERVKVEFHKDGVRINVYREYISPSLLLSFKTGTRGIFDVFELKRVAGYIGYVKTNHYWTEAETLDAAIEKMENGSQRLLSDQSFTQKVQISEEFELSFTDWLTKQKNRESPLGDLARKRGFMDKGGVWPLYHNLEKYKDYLTFNQPPLGAMATLEKAWKAYKAFLQRKQSSISNKQMIRPALDEFDSRTIVFVKNIKPLHYSKRTIENFVAGDKAWISWNGRKAIPVTVLEADEMYYTFRIERPLTKAGNQHYVRLDEIRSTPELACLNCISF